MGAGHIVVRSRCSAIASCTARTTVTDVAAAEAHGHCADLHVAVLHDDGVADTEPAPPPRPPAWLVSVEEVVLDTLGSVAAPDAVAVRETRPRLPIFAVRTPGAPAANASPRHPAHGVL